MSRYLNFAKEISEALHREHQIDYRSILDSEPDYQIPHSMYNIDYLYTQYLWLDVAKLSILHTNIKLNVDYLRKKGVIWNIDYVPSDTVYTTDLNKPNQIIIAHTLTSNNYIYTENCSRNFVTGILHVKNKGTYNLLNSRLFDPNSPNKSKTKTAQFFSKDSWTNFKKEINTDFANTNKFYKLTLSDHTM